MLEIPPAIQTLLKSKQMTGENRPTGVLRMEPNFLGDINFFTEEPTARMSGYDDDNLKFQVSNYVLGADGREFCAIMNRSTTEIYIGRMDENEDYLYKSFPVTSIEATGISTGGKTDIDTRAGKRVVLKRRSDGRILMLVMTEETYEVANSINCYISNNGLGTDFTFLSNVYTGVQLVEGDFLFKDGWFLMLSLVRTAPNGDLYFSAVVTDRYYGTVRAGGMTIFKSIDNGLSWVQLHYARSLIGLESVTSPVIFGNGDVIFSGLIGALSTYFMYSTDEGITWDGTSIKINYDNLDLPGRNIYPDFGQMWESDVYYDVAQDALYRWCVYPLLVSVMYAPSIDRILANNQFNDIWYLLQDHILIQVDGHAHAPFESSRIGYIDKNYNGKWLLERSNYDDMILGVIFTEKAIRPKRITIDRTKGSASQATIVLDNKDGIYSPDNAESEWQGELWPNKGITVTLGYGAKQQKVFTGLIDEVYMSNYPAELTIQARDYSKLALDQTIRVEFDGQIYHTLNYIGETIEFIFSDLATRAGFINVNVEETGFTLDEINLSQESYADAFQRLAEIASFEWFCDEIGVLHFRKAVEAAPESEWVFREGEDIFSLGYTISDSEIHRNLVVISQDIDGNTIQVLGNWPAADYYGLPTGKTLMIQATDLASNAEQCAVLLAQASENLSTKPRKVEFVVVGNPYIQIGDCVTVIESTTTISEIYRVWSVTHNMSASGSPVFSTTIKCYWYASGGE